MRMNVTLDASSKIIGYIYIYIYIDIYREREREKERDRGGRRIDKWNKIVKSIGSHLRCFSYSLGGHNGIKKFVSILLNTQNFSFFLYRNFYIYINTHIIYIYIYIYIYI